MKFNFTNKEEQKDALREFLDGQGKWRYEYETSHVDAGNSLFECYICDGFSLKEVKDNNRDCELGELISKFEDKLPKKEIKEILLSNTRVEPGTIECRDNSLIHIPLGELEEQVSGIHGEVNGKKVNCVLEALTEGLTNEDKKDVRRALNECYWPDNFGDCIYVNADYRSWIGIVDVETVREELEEALKAKQTA